MMSAIRDTLRPVSPISRKLSESKDLPRIIPIIPTRSAHGMTKDEILEGTRKLHFMGYLLCCVKILGQLQYY